MFGLLHSEFVQSSAIRTWNCVAQIANLLWHKFHHLRDPIMPRSRRRHHSRSRSRSRSHSHERDREPKRRKIDESHRRTVSSQPEASNDNEYQIETLDAVTSPILSDNIDTETQNEKEENNTPVSSDNAVAETSNKSKEEKTEEGSNENKKQLNVSCEVDDDAPIEDKENMTVNYNCKVVLVDVGGDYTKPENETISNSMNETIQLDSDDDDDEQAESTSPSKAHLECVDVVNTPKKTGSSKQIQKKLESEKKRTDKQKEKEERELKRQKEKEEREMKKQKEKEEKNRVKEEKIKQKLEKDEQKLKEKMEKQEQRQKEKEIKEQKRREKEEKDEQKRKEKEQEKLKRQQEIDEKNREKAKIEEQKQKAAAVFVNFFVTRKTDTNEEKIQRREEKFMPFEIKSDMRLAPIRRRTELSDESKSLLDQKLQNQDPEASYLNEIKQGKSIRKTEKTWPLEESIQEDDVLVVEENTLGETIVEQKPKLERMRAKLLKFHENQRPPYFGTWRKCSKFVRPRNPFGKDETAFDYEVDSDDEWEDEGEGESLKGSDEDEKENDSENEYEVDNEFFVPHGHLSDDEIDDEQNAKLSPESHKTKLKLLKNEFEEEMKSKTQKIKPRVIGCIWYNKTQDNVEDAIHRYLQPFSIISNGQVQIVKRSNIISSAQKKTSSKQLEREHIPLFLKLIHGNVRKRKILINEFLEFLSNNGVQVEVSKIALGRQFKEFAQWMKCPEQGVMHNKMCWYVGEDVRKEFNVDVSLPNQWKSVKKNSTLD